MHRYTIDRFEGEWAVLEDERGSTFTVPRQWLPAGAREGAVLNASAQAAGVTGTTVRFELDPAAQDERLTEARRLRDQLPRAPKGDMSL